MFEVLSAFPGKGVQGPQCTKSPGATGGRGGLQEGGEAVPWGTTHEGTQEQQQQALSGTEGSLWQAHTTEEAAQAKQGTDL